MKELTNRELKILQILWEIKKGFVNDIIAKLPDPKPPYTTVSSIVRILESKGYVDHKTYGNTHEYKPTISKVKYIKYALKSLISNYFEGSLENVVSFMAKENELSEKEANEIATLIENFKNKRND